MTEQQKFLRYMKKAGFELDGVLVKGMKPLPAGTFPLIGCHRKTENGDHNLISGMRFVDFGGSNVKNGDLGCVVFYYSGVTRKKYCKNSYQSEILKKTCCPKTAKKAIEIYGEWKIETYKTLQSWKVIL